MIGLVLAIAMVASAAVNVAGIDTDGDGLSNTFEVAYGLNPNSADTDHDRLLDPAEDMDGDGLSNIAEQTLGTDPTNPDTDGDGTNDGADDANRNDVPDWREQDDRALPSPLRPPLDQASSDNYCYLLGTGSTGNCVGDPNGRSLVAIYGDSHAGQWIAALQIVALHRHWRLEGLAKSACPSVHVDSLGDSTRDADCRSWRAQTERALRNQPPRLIILTNYSHYGLLNPAVTPKTWRAGLEATLAALPKTSQVLILADVPRIGFNVPACLAQSPNDVGACEVPRSTVYEAGHNRIESQVARTHDAAFASVDSLICPTRLCPVVIGHFLVWRDAHHLTVPYAKQLAPALGGIVAPYMR